MTLSELRQRWEARRAEYDGVGALVDGVKLMDAVLRELATLADDREAALYTPTEAAARVGYHPESICRLIRSGKVPNHGTKHRPRVKLSEIPRKATPRPLSIAKPRASGATSPAALSLDAVAGRIGRGA